MFVTALIVALPAATIIVYSGFQARNAAIQDVMLEADHPADETTSLQRRSAMGTEPLLSALAQLPEVRSATPPGPSPKHPIQHLRVADTAGQVWVQANALSAALRVGRPSSSPSRSEAATGNR